MRACIDLFGCLALALLLGCAGPTFSADEAPEYLALRDQVPLFRYGPQQSGAPETYLGKGERVRMLRHELGFSLVLTIGGETGYVANEDLAATPPLASFSPPASAGGAPSSSVAAPSLPKPDLDATPADAPAR